MLPTELAAVAFAVQGIGFAIVFRNGFQGLKQKPTKYTKMFDQVPLGNAFMALLLFAAGGMLLVTQCPSTNVFPLNLRSGANYLANSTLEVFAQDAGMPMTVYLGNNTTSMVLVANESFMLNGVLGGVLITNISVATVVPQEDYYRTNYTAATFNAVYVGAC